jgi:ABC-type antimicrobial peptide transport system permease subunit
MTKTWGRITKNGSNSWGYSWPNSKPEDYDVVFNNMSSDADFCKTMGITLIAGRDIDIYTYPTDSTALLLNEAAVERMGLQSPIGAQIISGKGTPYQQISTVVGVIQNFVSQSPYAKIEPLLIQGPASWFDFIHIRLNNNNNLLSNIDALKTIIQKYNPNYPMELQFADDAYAKKFVQQKRTAKLTALFSSLAIFIACLGLFGMVSFATIQRQKEIGIRKVLGASISGIIHMLSRDFIKLVLIAAIIASPIAWWIMNQWLQDYTYRTTIHWWIFLLAGIVSLFIALMTISSLAIKAARANPADSLRDE